MKKAIKIFAVVLTFAIAMCIGVLASGCGEKEATEFTITVLYPDGSPVNGTTDGNGNYMDSTYGDKVIKVQFCDADNEDVCWGTMPVLGADGKLTQSISDIKATPSFANVTNFSVHINGLPDNYTYDDHIVLNSKNASVTVTLQEK